MTSKPLTFLILGCGGRGNCFSGAIERMPEHGKVVAVADPDAERRNRIADKHEVPAAMRFASWEEALAKPKLADVAINTLMDRLHVASAIKAMEVGYHMLLEKPMATSLADCVAIDAARRKHDRIVAVCHNMRYARAFEEFHRQVRSGVIGDIVSYDQLEGVDHTHQAHSFVRGNWGNEGRSAFMLLAKSCHDIDAICYIIDKPVQRVSSFGSLTHFTAANAPAGAPQRCTDGCPVEKSCPYSALKLYVGESGKRHWYAHHAGLADLPEKEQIARLKTSPYGRCVYRCDNDVVDHQVVAMEFAGGVTATFTMTAFTPFGGRWMRVHGTKGYIKFALDERVIEVWRYDSGVHQRIEVPVQSSDSHGGSDLNIFAAFVDAVRRNDPSAVLTTTAESLRTHAVVFAAEQSRRERRMVEMSEVLKQTQAATAS